MFDRPLVIIPSARHVTERVTEHVHEHRAPTDASVRLLAEMEAAARDKIIEAVHVGDTTFQCVVHMQRELISDKTRLIAVFSLNGKKLTAEHVAECVASARPPLDEPVKAFAALRDAIALKIATEVLGAALQNLRF